MSQNMNIASNVRFEIGMAVGGYEVVDRDGRPVSEVFPEKIIATNAAAELNEAASKGRSTLANALGALEYEV